MLSDSICQSWAGLAALIPVITAVQLFDPLLPAVCAVGRLLSTRHCLQNSRCSTLAESTHRACATSFATWRQTSRKCPACPTRKCAQLAIRYCAVKGHSERGQCRALVRAQPLQLRLLLRRGRGRRRKRTARRRPAHKPCRGHRLKRNHQNHRARCLRRHNEQTAMPSRCVFWCFIWCDDDVQTCSCLLSLHA